MIDRQRSRRRASQLMFGDRVHQMCPDPIDCMRMQSMIRNDVANGAIVSSVGFEIAKAFETDWLWMEDDVRGVI